MLDLGKEELDSPPKVPLSLPNVQSSKNSKSCSTGKSLKRNQEASPGMVFDSYWKKEGRIMGQLRLDRQGRRGLVRDTWSRGFAFVRHKYRDEVAEESPFPKTFVDGLKRKSQSRNLLF
ncbi:hypothetical protein Droror1_Dr00025186 [Drosera rotundifolia]